MIQLPPQGRGRPGVVRRIRAFERFFESVLLGGSPHGPIHGQVGALDVNQGIVLIQLIQVFRHSVVTVIIPPVGIVVPKESALI